MQGINYVPFPCYNEKLEKAHLFFEEKLTEAFVGKCKKCNRPYFKKIGCNRIICVCGCITYYVCEKEIAGYDHFNE